MISLARACPFGGACCCLQSAFVSGRGWLDGLEDNLSRAGQTGSSSGGGDAEAAAELARASAMWTRGWVYYWCYRVLIGVFTVPALTGFIVSVWQLETAIVTEDHRLAEQQL
eukprot:SAG11_NODE_2687_length_3096_cov_1.771104_6_plen_111_part_01